MADSAKDKILITPSLANRISLTSDDYTIEIETVASNKGEQVEMTTAEQVKISIKAFIIGF